MTTDAELAAMLAAEQPPPAPSDANRRTVYAAAGYPDLPAGPLTVIQCTDQCGSCIDGLVMLVQALTGVPVWVFGHDVTDTPPAAVDSPKRTVVVELPERDAIEDDGDSEVWFTKSTDNVSVELIEWPSGERSIELSARSRQMAVGGDEAARQLAAALLAAAERFELDGAK